MVEYGFLCEWAVYYYYQSEWQVTEINWKTPTGLIWLIKSACSDDETQNDDALPKQRQICGSFWNAQSTTISRDLLTDIYQDFLITAVLW